MAKRDCMEEGHVKRRKVEQWKKDLIQVIYVLPSYYSPFNRPLQPLQWCAENSASAGLLSADGMKAMNEGGYQTIRTNYGVFTGSYYFEVELLGPSAHKTIFNIDINPPHSPSIRIGYSTEKANSALPVGSDRFGYGVRVGNQEAHQVHESRIIPLHQAPNPYTHPLRIGCLIKLPPLPSEDPIHDLSLPIDQIQSLHIQDELPQPKDELVEGRRVVYQYVPKPYDGNIPTHPGSKIEYFINGESIGIPFQDIHRGIYYPTVSLYMGAAIEAHFNPPIPISDSTVLPFQECTADPLWKQRMKVIHNP